MKRQKVQKKSEVMHSIYYIYNASAHLGSFRSLQRTRYAHHYNQLPPDLKPLSIINRRFQTFKIDGSHLAVFCSDRNAIGSYDFVRIQYFRNFRNAVCKSFKVKCDLRGMLKQGSLYDKDGTLPLIAFFEIRTKEEKALAIPFVLIFLLQRFILQFLYNTHQFGKIWLSFKTSKLF